MYGNEYQDIGFSLKSMAKSIKKLKNKITGGGKKKKVTKPTLLEDPIGPGTQQRVPIGFPVITFVNAGPTSQITTVNPQKPFMPRRLIITPLLLGAAVGQVLLSSFVIATEDMLAGSGSIPVEAFAANATDMVLMTRAARPGINISLRFDFIGVIPVGDSCVVSAVMMGDAVSQ